VPVVVAQNLVGALFWSPPGCSDQRMMIPNFLLFGNHILT
jgi:hypothetical protein